MKRYLGIIMCMAVLAPADCEKQKEAPILHEQVKAQSPIKLAAMPDFNHAVSEAQPNKGIYTTWGVIFNQAKLLNTTVRVKGKIVDVTRDCPQITKPAPKKQAKSRHRNDANGLPAEKCLGLGVWIESPDNRHHRVMVVGYHPYYQPYLTIGTEIDVTGKYVLHANVLGLMYVEPENGLIIADELHGMAVSKSGNFTNNRAEINDMISKGELAELPKRIE